MEAFELAVGLRSQTLVTSQAALVGWVVAVIVAAAGSAVLDSHFVYLDMSRIEASISQDLRLNRVLT